MMGLMKIRVTLSRLYRRMGLLTAMNRDPPSIFNPVDHSNLAIRFSPFSSSIPLWQKYSCRSLLSF